MMMVLKNALPVVLIGLGPFGFPTLFQEARRPVQWVAYEPSKTQLTGRIIIQTKYGPPGYGEDRTHDKKVRIYVLVLRTPISARASTEYETVENVSEIEIFFRNQRGANSWSAAHRAIGKCVSITGEIHQSRVAAEFTPLVMEVDLLSLLKESRPRGLSIVWTERRE